MDTQRVNDKAEEYHDRSIRLTLSRFEDLGIEKSSIALKVGDYSIACVPFDISIRRASLLTVLNDKESSFFSRYQSGSHRLFMTWNSPYSSKPETFYVTCRIRAFRRPSPYSPYCFIDLEFSSAPFAYKEMLVGYFSAEETARAFYEESQDFVLSPDQRKALLGGDSLVWIREAGGEERFKVLSLSPRRLVVFGEHDETGPSEGTTIEFRAVDGEVKLELKGECVQVRLSAEAPGFATLEIALDFTASAHGRMRGIVGRRPGSGVRKP